VRLSRGSVAGGVAKDEDEGEANPEARLQRITFQVAAAELRLEVCQG